jgi:hypothetical protein
MDFPRNRTARRSTFLLVVILGLGIGAFRIEAADSSSSGGAPSSEEHPSNFDGPAELPRVHVDSSLRATPAPGKTLMVKAGDDPSEVLAKASCGDTVELQAGATFEQLIVPAKQCDDAHWIIIRTSAPDAKLPPEGTRLTPCYGGVASLPGRPAFECHSTENVLAKIEFNKRSGNGPVKIESGANHYRFIGLEVTRSESAGIAFNLVGPDKEGTADHIILDRMWLHGDAHQETVRGVMLSHIRYAAVVDSYLNDFHCIAKTGTCVDSQAVAGGHGNDPMGPFKIVNNFLEASGENVMFGGSGATVSPSDIEVRHNHMFKPMTWLRGQPGFVGGNDGSPFIVKNLFEIKNAQRVLFEGNILEGSWGGFSQSGFGVVLTPKNQQIGTLSVCPSCQVTDITIRNCRISHVGSGVLIGNGITTIGGAAKDGGRYSIHDVVVDDIQNEAYSGFGVFAQISTAIGDSAAPRLHDVKIDHVTGFPSRALFLIGGPLHDPRMSNVSITNSIFTTGTLVIVTPGGGPERNCAAMPRSKSIDTIFHDCFSSFRFEDNIIVGGGSGWPKDNPIVGKIADVGFSNYANGNGGDYTLSPHSKFKHAASDHKDPGADIRAIEQATKGAE